MTNPNIEIRIITFRKNGQFQTHNILEETKSENQGKGGAKPTNPQLKESQLDEYF